MFQLIVNMSNFNYLVIFRVLYLVFLLFISFTDCSIEFSGFDSDNTYTVSEPDVGMWMNNTVLIQKSNCTSEQTFYIGVSVGPAQLSTASSATLDTLSVTNDYHIGTPGIGYTELVLLPHQQLMPFQFYLNPDSLFEGREAFKIVISFSRFSLYSLREQAYVFIRDNDSKFTSS